MILIGDHYEKAIYMYELINQEFNKALEWYKLAARQGNADAISILKKNSL